MFLKIQREVLLQALTHQQSVITKRTTIPALAYTLFKIEPSSEHPILSMTGTDLELSLVTTLSPIAAEGEEALAIPATLLYDIVRKLPEKSVLSLKQHEDEKGFVRISCPPIEFKLPVLSAAEFPPITMQQLPLQWTMRGSDLKSLISSVRFAMSQEEGRFALNGIFFHVHHNKWRAVATDAHRLALSEISIPADIISSVPSVLIGRKAIYEMVKLFEHDEEVIISLSKTQISCTAPGRVFYARLIDAQFPDYQPALNKATHCTLTVHTQSLSDAVERVNMVVNEKNKVIKMTLMQDKAVFSAYSPESGFASDEIDLTYQGPSCEIGFNPRYILDICQHLKAETMNIAFGTPMSSSPVQFCNINESGTLYVLMPAIVT